MCMCVCLSRCVRGGGSSQGVAGLDRKPKHAPAGCWHAPPPYLFLFLFLCPVCPWLTPTPTHTHPSLHPPLTHNRSLAS